MLTSFLAEIAVEKTSCLLAEAGAPSPTADRRRRSTWFRVPALAAIADIKPAHRPTRRPLLVGGPAYRG